LPILHEFIFSFIRGIRGAVESFYPEEVSRRSRFPRQAGVPAVFDTKGTGVSLECGVSVRMFLTFGGGSGRIDGVHFASNGCGWAVAAAEVIAEKISGASLRELHALEDIREEIVSEIGEIPSAREQCVQIGLEAVRKALADHRERIAEEWTGEKALICSCFGISEGTIEEIVAKGSASVEEVGSACSAGTGCGSCQMLIREIIESEGK
jgi:NifU-like protein involved in Fe-S cluster formation/bacterioferritin-associated ferredoxin